MEAKTITETEDILNLMVVFHGIWNGLGKGFIGDFLLRKLASEVAQEMKAQRSEKRSKWSHRKRGM